MTGTVALLAGRTIRRFLRSPQLVTATVAFPLILMFTMLATFGRLVESVTHSAYVDRLAPLIVLSTVSFGTALTAVGVFEDVRTGFFARIRSMPLAGGAVVAGRIVGELARILAVAALVTLVACVVGFRFRQGPVAVFGYFGVVLLVGVMFTALAVWVGLIASTPVAIQNLLNVPAAVLFFLSSGFVPVSAFPGFVQPVVRANPLSTADAAMVGLASGGPVAAPMLSTLAWATAIALICGGLAVARLRSAARS